MSTNSFDISIGKMKRIALISLVISLCSLLVLIILQLNYQNKSYGEKDIERFERVLHSKESLLREEFSSLSGEFEDTDPGTVLNSHSDEYKRLAEESGIYIYYFQDGRMVYWSDHTVPIRPVWNKQKDKLFFELRNASYVSVKMPAGEGVLFGLIQIRTTYPYENEYLTNEFHDDFPFSSSINITNQHEDHQYKISNQDGDFLFSLDMSENPRKNHSNITWSIIWFLLSLLSLFSFFLLAYTI